MLDNLKTILATILTSHYPESQLQHFPSDDIIYISQWIQPYLPRKCLGYDLGGEVPSETVFGSIGYIYIIIYIIIYIHTVSLVYVVLLLLERSRSKRETRNRCPEEQTDFWGLGDHPSGDRPIGTGHFSELLWSLELQGGAPVR